MIGAMTASWGPWPIWGIRSAIRRSAMSCTATLFRPHLSESARQPGRHSFGVLGGFALRRLLAVQRRGRRGHRSFETKQETIIDRPSPPL